MKFREIGKTGIQASVIGLGTWVMGGDSWGGSNDKESLNAIDVALDNGINLIDTAPIYGFGLAEELVGKAIAKRRDKVILSTKAGLNWHTQQGSFLAKREDKHITIYRYLAKDFLKQELENSLKRLQTDYIDVYFTHWQDETTPIEETMEALLQFKKEGKIRAIGVSNANLNHLKRYQQAGGIDVDQEEYSLLNRSIEKEILPFCEKEHISMFAYCPLCQGLLTGKIKPSYAFKDTDMRKGLKSFSDKNLERVSFFLQKAEIIAKKYQVSFSQLFIAWTLTQVTHVLCGGRNSNQVKENLLAGSIDLAPEDVEAIRFLAIESNASFKMLD